MQQPILKNFPDFKNTNNKTHYLKNDARNHLIISSRLLKKQNKDTFLYKKRKFMFERIVTTKYIQTVLGKEPRPVNLSTYTYKVGALFKLTLVTATPPRP